MKQYNIETREERRFLARLRDIHKLSSFKIQIGTPSNRFLKKQHHIKRILAKILKEHKLQAADRDDVLQNCYLYLHRKICNGQMPKNLSTALHQRIRRAIIRIHRHHHRWCTGYNLDRCVLKENSILTSNQIDEIRVHKILHELPSHMKTVITRRFGLDGYNTETLEEIGFRMHLSRERVRQVELQGLSRLRAMLDDSLPFQERKNRRAIVANPLQKDMVSPIGGNPFFSWLPLLRNACGVKYTKKTNIPLRMCSPDELHAIKKLGDGVTLYTLYSELKRLLRKSTGERRRAISEEMNRLIGSRANIDRVCAVKH